MVEPAVPAAPARTKFYHKFWGLSIGNFHKNGWANRLCNLPNPLKITKPFHTLQL